MRNTMIHLKASDVSLDGLVASIRNAFDKIRIKYDPSTMSGKADSSEWLKEVFETYVIVERGSDMLFKAEYSIDKDGVVTFSPRADWTPVKVEKKYVDVQNMMGNLPPAAAKIFERVFKKAKDANEDDETAGKKAWGAVERAGWHKNGKGAWVVNATQRMYNYDRIPEEPKRIFDAAFHDKMREPASPEDSNRHAMKMCNEKGWHMCKDGRWEKRDKNGNVIGGNSMRAKALKSGKGMPGKAGGGTKQNADFLTAVAEGLGYRVVFNGGARDKNGDGKGSGNFGHPGYPRATYANKPAGTGAGDFVKKK